MRFQFSTAPKIDPLFWDMRQVAGTNMYIDPMFKVYIRAYRNLFIIYVATIVHDYMSPTQEAIKQK
jgi:hypothetical protein